MKKVRFEAVGGNDFLKFLGKLNRKPEIFVLNVFTQEVTYFKYISINLLIFSFFCILTA